MARPNKDTLDAVPKDRGWAWLVLLAGFLVNMIPVGIMSQAPGILLTAVAEKFNSTGIESTMIIGIANCIGLGTSPLSSWLATMYGSRVLVVIGAFLMCLGFVVSAFAPVMQIMYFSYGILFGFGASLTFTPTISMVLMYFEKYSALAMGLAFSGSAVGSVALPPLLTWLLRDFGLNITLLVVGGLLGSMMLCGLLLRPITYYNKKKEVAKTETFGQVNDAFDGENKVNNVTVADHHSNNATGTNQTNSGPNGCIESESSNVTYGCTNNASNTVITSGHTTPTVSSEQTDITEYANCHDSDPSHTRSHNNVADDMGPNTDIAVIKCQSDYAAKKAVFFTTETTQATEVSDKNSKTFDWRVVKNPIVCMYCVATVFCFVAHGTVLTIVPSLSESKGGSKEVSRNLLMIVGATDFVGRLAFGAFNNIPWVSKRYVYQITLFLSMGFAVAMPFYQEYLLPLNACYGFFSGNAVVNVPVIFREVLPLPMVASSLGCAIMCQGVGYLISMAVAGALYNLTGSWDIGFWFAGTSMGLGAAVIFFEPLAQNCIRKWAKEKLPLTCSTSDDTPQIVQTVVLIRYVATNKGDNNGMAVNNLELIDNKTLDV